MTDKERLDPERVHMMLQESLMDSAEPAVSDDEPVVANDDVVTIQTRRKLIRPRGANQTAYAQNA